MLMFLGVQATETSINVDTVNQEMNFKNEGMSQSTKDSILLHKLSPDQLMQLEREKIDIEKQKNEAQNKVEMPPINGLGIVLICLMPFLFLGIEINI